MCIVGEVVFQMVGTFLESEFRSWLKERGLSDKSIMEYTVQSRMFFDHIENKKVKNQEEFIDLVGKYIIAKLRCYNVRFAIKHYLTFIGKKNIYEKVNDKYRRRFKKLPRLQEKKSVPFSAIKYIADNLNMPYKLIFMIQYDTAFRISDVLKLRYENIELDDDGMVSVIVKEKKTGKLRTLYITKDTAYILAKYIKIMGKTPDSKLFTTDKSHYNRKLQKVGANIGYPKISSHWVRSSRAVHLLKKGYDIISVKNLLAHKDISTTQLYVLDAGIDSKKLMKAETPEW